VNTVPAIDSSVSSPPAPRVSLARIGALRLMVSERAEAIIEIS
jgi:hypothetical protein